MPIQRPARWLVAAVPILATLGVAVAAAGERTPHDVVKAVVERSCSNCHRASGPGGVRDPVKDVVPGFAEASPLFRILLSRHGGDTRITTAAWPDAEEIEAVRAAIDGWTDTASDRTSEAVPATLRIETDRPRYRPGDSIRIQVTSRTDCHLTLVSIDPSGDAVVLFPNDFERETLVQADNPRRLPGPGAAYRLKAQKPGTERLVAWCATEPGPLAGLRYAFGSQRFRLLGPWPEALEELLEASAAAESNGRTRRRSGREAEGPSLFGPHGYAAYRFVTE